MFSKANPPPKKRLTEKKFAWEAIEERNSKKKGKKTEDLLQTCIDSSGNINLTTAQKMLASDALVPVAALSQLILTAATNMFIFSINQTKQSELKEQFLNNHTNLIILALNKATQQKKLITDWKQSASGNNALHYAVMLHHFELIQALCTHDAQIVKLKNSQGLTALEIAFDDKIYDNLFTLSELLLHYPNFLASKEKEKEHQIVTTASKQDTIINIIKLLLSVENDSKVLVSAYTKLFLRGGISLGMELLQKNRHHQFGTDTSLLNVALLSGASNLNSPAAKQYIMLAKLIFDRISKQNIVTAYEHINNLVQFIENNIKVNVCLPILIELISPIDTSQQMMGIPKSFSNINDRDKIEAYLASLYIRVFRQLILYNHQDIIVAILNKDPHLNLCIDNELVSLALERENFTLATALLKHSAHIDFQAIHNRVFELITKHASDESFIAFIATMLTHHDVDKNIFILLFNRFVEHPYAALALVALKIAKDRGFILDQATLLLHQAIQHQQTDLALKLLALHRDQINVNADIKGNTAFLLALECNNQQLMTYMLEHADELKMNEKAIGLTAQARTPKTTATSSIPYSCRFLGPCQDQSVATILIEDAEKKLVQKLKKLIFACSSMQQLISNGKIKTNKYTSVSASDDQDEREKEMLPAVPENKNAQQKQVQNIELEKGLAIHKLIKGIYDAKTCQEIIKIVKDEEQKIHHQLNRPSNTIGWMFADIKQAESARLFAAFRLEFAMALDANPHLKEIASLIKDKKKDLKPS